MLLAFALLAGLAAGAESDAPVAVPAGREGLVVRRAERLVLHIPFRDERVRRHMHRANSHDERVMIYRIELADGTVGWGEGIGDHGAAGPGLVGRNVADVMKDNGARFGFQMAAIDAAGRSLGVPAWQLLGRKLRARVPIAWWAIDMPPEDLAAEMAEAVRRGYTSAKLKPRPWWDLMAQLDAVEKAVPKGFSVVLDFNGFLLDARQAQAYLGRIDARPVVGGYESPFYLQSDTAGAARLREALAKPVYEHFQDGLPRTQAADGFVVTSNYMPLDYTRGAQEQCAAADRPYWLQLVGTGITAAFLAHLGAVNSQATLPGVTCHELWEDDLLTGRLEVKDGAIAVPDGPGLGVGVDADAIARYRVGGPGVPTAKELEAALPRTIRIHIPPAGDVGTVPAGAGVVGGNVLDFPSEDACYREFLEGRHPGFRPGTRLEVVDRPSIWKQGGEAKPDRLATYANRGGRELTLGVFTPPGVDPARPRPALMIIHGGSWVSGAPDLFHAHSRYFAQRGLVVFNVDYRLAAAGGATIFNCMEDVQAALRYIRAQARGFGIDPRRVAVAGDSAGGHLAACLGVAMPAQELGLDPTWDLADAVVLWNPEVDLTTLRWAKGTPGLAEEIASGPGAGLPGSARLRLVSPIFHVGPKLPPCLVIHGTKDDCVSIEQSVRYEAAMKQAGNACRLLTYEGVAHAFILPQYGSEALATRAMRDTERFLVEQGYLEADPPKR